MISRSLGCCKSWTNMALELLRLLAMLALGMLEPAIGSDSDCLRACFFDGDVLYALSFPFQPDSGLEIV